MKVKLGCLLGCGLCGRSAMGRVEGLRMRYEENQVAS